MTSIESLATAIARSGRDAVVGDPVARGSDWQIAIVTAVSVTPGTVDCGTIRARRLDSYIAPAVGDQIMLTRSGSGNWLAVGRTSAAPDTWQDYTPVFNTANGSGSIGNGNIVGRYLKTGRRVDFEIQCTFGSTTNFGSNSFNFSLPVLPATRSTVAICPARLTDTSASAAYAATGQIGGTQSVGFIAAGTSSIAAGSPFTWAATDIIRISGTYESAS